MHVCANTNTLPASQHYLTRVSVGVFLPFASVFLDELQGHANEKQKPKSSFLSLIMSVLEVLGVPIGINRSCND